MTFIGLPVTSPHREGQALVARWDDKEECPCSADVYCDEEHHGYG